MKKKEKSSMFAKPYTVKHGKKVTSDRKKLSDLLF